MSEKTFNCDQCESSFKTRSGLWKHKKTKHPTYETVEVKETTSSGVEEVEPSSPPPSSVAPVESPEDTSPSWMDWDFERSDENTDSIPTAFKSIVKSPPMGSKKLSKAQLQALESQNLGILKMGLTTIDVLLSKYGQAVSLDQDFEVKHSDSDKNLVANAQYRYLEEKGLFLTNYLSTGMIAGALTSWYITAPVLRIRKKAKRKFFKSRGLFARLPLIGRFFRRKESEPSIAQNVEVEPLES